MIELHKRFGEVIRRRRIAAGWSQEEFADRAGLRACENSLFMPMV